MSLFEQNKKHGTATKKDVSRQIWNWSDLWTKNLIPGNPEKVKRGDMQTTYSVPNALLGLPLSDQVHDHCLPLSEAHFFEKVSLVAVEVTQIIFMTLLSDQTRCPTFFLQMPNPILKDPIPWPLPALADNVHIVLHRPVDQLILKRWCGCLVTGPWSGRPSSPTRGSWSGTWEGSCAGSGGGVRTIEACLAILGELSTCFQARRWTRWVLLWQEFLGRSSVLEFWFGHSKCHLFLVSRMGTFGKCDRFRAKKMALRVPKSKFKDHF